MFFQKSSSAPARTNRGFALVITLSLMMLIALIAVALLSLSTIALRGGNDGAIARANARMALILAIGQLQKHTGPDQRVTATAAILGAPGNTKPSNDSATADDVENPHWVGVWRTDRLNGETNPTFTPLIYREIVNPKSDQQPPADPSSKWDSITDRRSDEGITYKAESQVILWLVSNPNSNPQTILNPMQELPGKDAVMILGNESADDKFRVNVPKILLTNDKAQVAGSLAWWTSDESVKARFDLKVPQVAPAKEFSGLVPPVFGIQQVEGLEGYETVTPAEAEKVVSAKSMELLENRMPEVLTTGKERFHAVTVNSMGVLADSLNGGLKRDLGTILRTGEAAELGQPDTNSTYRPKIDANTPVFNTLSLRHIGPKFGLLMSWAGLAEDVSATDPPELKPQKATSRANLMRNVYEWGNSGHYSAGIDLKNQNQVGIHPVLVDASISYGASLYKNPATETNYGIRLHYSPHIVIWNPYNVRLKETDYAVQLSMLSNIEVVAIRKDNGTQYKLTASRNSPNLKLLENDANRNSPFRPSFLLKGVTLEPGEALLFTCPQGHKKWGDATTANNATLDYFPLVANASQPLNGSFYFDIQPTSGTWYPIPAAARDLLNYVIWTPFSTGDYTIHTWAKLGIAKDSNASCKAGWLDENKIEPLQFVTETEDGAHASNAPCFGNALAAGAVPNDVALLGLTPGDPGGMPSNDWFPFIRQKFGRRLMWLTENSRNLISIGNVKPPYYDYNLIASHNLRAGWSMRSVAENVYRIGGVSQQYGWQIFGQRSDDPYYWSWDDSSLLPDASTGKNRVSPFGAPASFGAAVYPLFQIPSVETPLLSLGMLQHVPLSPLRWHPSYAIGNSLADPRVPRDKTTNFVKAADWTFGGGNHAKDWNITRQLRPDPTLSLQNWHYDLSYEANHELWNHYFISSLPEQLPTSAPLPNPRIQPRADLELPEVRADLDDPNRAAKQLMIAGAFNVNSASVDAWEALLTSFSANPNLVIEGNDGEKIDATNVFSRLLSPYDENANGVGFSDQSMWNGYRKLTPLQIERLAEEIVKQVKIRGPFLSVADFINRRLVGPEDEDEETGLKGALQAAIDATEINKSITEQFPIAKTEYRAGHPPNSDQVSYNGNYPDVRYPMPPGSVGYSREFGRKPDHMHWPESKLTGAPGFLTQADVLQKLGPVLTARGDTFVIRAYGESRDPVTGAIRASARLEAVVQRMPDPMVPDPATGGLDPLPPASPADLDWGRRFVIQSVRWLQPNEV